MQNEHQNTLHARRNTKTDCEEEEQIKLIAKKKRHETILQGRIYTKTQCKVEGNRKQSA